MAEHKPLRGALIGCGFFAANHVRAWRDVEGAELVAVCDLDRRKAEDAAALAGSPVRIHLDAERLFAEEALDFVDICTTMESHRALMALAARFRVPAICQKPLAPGIADARAIVETARAAGTPIMVHENFRFERPLLAVKQAIDEGVVGRPFFAHVSWRTGFDVIKGQPYLAKVERFLLLDLGIHVLDVARFLLGDVRRVYARTNRMLEGTKGEDTAIIVLDHDSGAVSEVVCSYATRIEPDLFPQTLVEVEGSEGSLRLKRDYRLEVHTSGGCEIRDVSPRPPAWADPAWALVQESVVNTQTHWIRSLVDGTEPATSGRDNLATFALVEAAYLSAASGQPVVPEA